MGQACPWHVRHRPCGAAAQGRGQLPATAIAVALRPCPARLLADWCAACVCHSLPLESYNQMGTAEGVRRSGGAPAESDPCLRGRTAARSGSGRPLIHLTHRSPAAALLLAGGGRVRGKKNRLVGTTAKRIPLFSVRAGQSRSKKWLQTIACSSWARSYVPRCHKHTGGEWDASGIPDREGGIKQGRVEGGYTLKL
jgi:hypothetical protein